MPVFLDVKSRLDVSAANLAAREAVKLFTRAGEDAGKAFSNPLSKALGALDTSAMRRELNALSGEHARLAAAAEESARRQARAMGLVEAQQRRMMELTGGVANASLANSAKMAKAETDLANAKAIAARETRQHTEAMAAAAAASGNLATASERAGSSANRAGQLFNAAGIGGVAILGATMFETTKKAGDFQQQMMKLHAAAGETSTNMKTVSDGILQMAGKVGYSTTELANAMYTIEKAGFRGADGIKVLSAAAQGAGAEQADLMEVVNGLTTSMTDFNVKPEESARLMSQMVTAVGTAKTSFQDFAGALHSVEPVAAAAHLKLEDVWGSMAQLTQSGTSPEQATENMRNAINAFTGQSGPARDAMAQFGINADEVSQKLSERGLAGTMQYLYKTVQSQLMPGMKLNQGELLKNAQAASDLNDMITQMSPHAAELATQLKNNEISVKDYTKASRASSAEDRAKLAQFGELNNKLDGFSKATRTGRDVVETLGKAMRDMTGTVAGQSVALQLAGEHTDETNDRIRQIATTYTEADGSVKGFNETQETLNAKTRDAHAAFGAAAAEIGSAFVPVMTQVANIAKTVGDEMAKHPGIAHAVVGGLEAIAGAWVAIKAMNIVEMLTGITRGLGGMTAAEDAAAASAGGLRGALAGIASVAGPVAAATVAADQASGMAQDSSNPLLHAAGDAFRHNPASLYGLYNMVTGRHAHGGAIHGHGPKGRDSVPAILAPGEHVLTHHDVHAMGGHSAVYNFRSALHRQYGGAVGDDAGGPVSRLYQEAHTLNGGRYVWGSTDCSGAVSMLVDAALGTSGRMSTATAAQWLSSKGFQSGMGGPGSLSIGWYNGGPGGGHMAATLPDGTHFESGGQHGGIMLGGSAAGAETSEFTNHMHLPLKGFYPDGPAGGMGGMTGMAGAFGGGGGGGFGGGSIPAGSTAGTGPGGQAGYYTPDAGKVATAQERLRHLDEEIANAEKRKGELKATAKQSERDRLDEEIRHLHEERDRAQEGLGKAQQGTFHAMRGGRGGRGGAGLPVPLDDHFGLGKGLPGLAEYAVSFLEDLVLGPMETAVMAGLEGGDMGGAGGGSDMPGAALTSFTGGAGAPFGGGGGGDFGGGGGGGAGPLGGGGAGPSGAGAARRPSTGIPGMNQTRAPGSLGGAVPGMDMARSGAPLGRGRGIHTQNDYKLFQAGVIDADGNVITGRVGPDLSGLLNPSQHSGSPISPMIAPGDPGLLGGGEQPGAPGFRGAPPSSRFGPGSQTPPQTLLPPLHRSGGGPSGTDTIPAWLSPGEFVMNSNATKQYLPSLQFMNAAHYDTGSGEPLPPSGTPAPPPKTAGPAQPPGAKQQPGTPGSPAIAKLPGGVSAPLPMGMAGPAGPPPGSQPSSDIHNLPGLATPGADSPGLAAGLPASPGLGISGGAIGSAEGAASAAGDMFAPGSGAAAQIGFQLINRAASFGAQAAGIGVEGILESLIPSSGSTGGDWAKTIPGRLLMGVTGVRPTGQNTAGNTTGPAAQSEGGGQGSGVGFQLNGDMHVHTPDAHSFSDQMRNETQAAGGAYPMSTAGR